MTTTHADLVRLTAHALPRGEAARIVRDGVHAAHPWLRPRQRQDRPIPATVPFARVQRLVADLLGPDALKDLRGLTLDRGAVVAELCARDDRGRRFLVGDELAVDRVHIRIER